MDAQSVENFVQLQGRPDEINVVIISLHTLACSTHQLKRWDSNTGVHSVTNCEAYIWMCSLETGERGEESLKERTRF